MEKKIKANHSLGNDWFANVWTDGSMTLRNPEIGQRIDLPAASVDLLREIFNEADRLHAA